MNYDLKAYVHPDIAALAVAMPAPAPDDLALETSSRLTGGGIASMRVARRLLSAGRATPAAKALLEAHDAFARVGHQVGLRRVKFLEDVVFDGDLAAFVGADDKAAKAHHATKRPKAIALDHPGRLTSKQWARALRQGQAQHILAVLAAHTDLHASAATRAGLAAALIVGRPAQVDATNTALADLCRAGDARR